MKLICYKVYSWVCFISYLLVLSTFQIMFYNDKKRCICVYCIISLHHCCLIETNVEPRDKFPNRIFHHEILWIYWIQETISFMNIKMFCFFKVKFILWYHWCFLLLNFHWRTFVSNGFFKHFKFCLSHTGSYSGRQCLSALSWKHASCSQLSFLDCQRTIFHTHPKNMRKIVT